jgi:alcohol dehydrogenase class IV
MRFEFATATRIVFGPGRIHEAGDLASRMGRRALVVTGASVDRAAPLLDQLAARGVAHGVFTVAGEPTIEDVARGVALARGQDADMVLAMGGGSALDAGKAVAALLGNGGEALDYLEVVGKGKPIHTRAAPFVAIPTTAGTGSEVTRNAVLGVPEERVKVSMRSALMLPHLAVVDPALTHSMPPDVTASTGLDALTHLIEAYVSSRANPLVDALCTQGMGLAARALRRAYHQGDDASARHDMALASLLGGMALANAGLGAVHGFAGPVGGMFPAPHGCVCGRFLPHVMEMNVRALQSRAPGSAILPRFAEVAGLLTRRNDATAGQGVDWIQDLCQELAVPPLTRYGMSAADIDEVVDRAQKASSMQANPIALTREELAALAARALG